MERHHQQLKPCPFCGGKAHIMKMGYLHCIYCEDCGAKVHGGVVGEEEGEQASIEAWNRRIGDVLADLDMCLKNINASISKRIVTKTIGESQKHEIQNEVNENINDYLYNKDVTYCCITLRFEKSNGESQENMLIVGKSFYEEDGGLQNAD